MKMSTVNVQSLTSGNKDMVISDILHEQKLDLCVLTETWLKQGDEDRIWIESCELNKNGYKLDIANRKYRTGGGLGLVYCDNLKVKCVDKDTLRSFEYAKWSVASKSCSFTMIGIYHPPYSATNKTTNTMFLDEFIPWCANNVITDKNIIITGVFNIHVNDTVDQEAMSFMELMEAVGLTQYVKFPTHKLGNTLDLVFAESTGCMNGINVVCGEFISDHCFTIWTTSKPRSDLLSKTITIKKLRDIDAASFSADIDLNCVLEIDKLDEILCEIDDNLLKTLDKHAPAKMKTNNCSS